MNTFELPASTTLATACFTSSGARNCPFLMFTTRPVRAAATMRSVWRERNAGICSTSATAAAGSACSGWWMSVMIGTSQVDFTDARTRKPSVSPGPRNDRPDVRFALSNDALKMNGTPTRRLISTSARAVSRERASLSMTHGPAIRTNGLPPPIVKSRSCTTGRLGHGLRGRPLHAGGLVLVARFDERGEQRVRARRLGLELRMELHRQVPRMAGQLGDLDELSIGRASGDAQPFLGERPLVEAVELVAVTMTLVNQPRAVDALRQRSGRQFAGVGAEAHRAAQLVHPEEIAQLVNHLRRRVRRALGGIRVAQAGHVARV